MTDVLLAVMGGGLLTALASFIRQLVLGSSERREKESAAELADAQSALARAQANELSRSGLERLAVTQATEIDRLTARVALLEQQRDDAHAARELWRQRALALGFTPIP